MSAAWRRPATARSVIFLFMEGGPSHLDTFDPKPELNRLAGQPLPPSFKPVITPMGEGRSPLLASQSEMETARSKRDVGLRLAAADRDLRDDLAVIRSCWSNGLNHVGGVCQMNTGSTLAGRPSLGSWVTYGLGSENANLPGFVVMQDIPRATVAGGPRNWGTGFIPAVYQGTRLDNGPEPIANLRTPAGCRSGSTAAASSSSWTGSTAAISQSRHDQSELDARIKSYELAFRMQAEAPEAVDLASETAETLALYGLDEAATETYRPALPAGAPPGRARGPVRSDLLRRRQQMGRPYRTSRLNHAKTCRAMDQPVAGLLTDLKRRGLLDQTLVVWGGEFGRTPMSEKGNGRDHNPYGFTMWMAGGGVKEGIVIGKTDDLGLHAIEERIHVHDIHATILHALGVDHSRLIYRHQGRPERPTVNEGQVCQALFKTSR